MHAERCQANKVVRGPLYIYTDPDTDIVYTADAGQGWFGGQAYGDPGMYEQPGAQFWGPTQQVISLTAFAL